MLVLSRQRDETIMIGDDIEITVVDIRGDKVRLGINAPARIAVHRKEVYEAIRSENQRTARSTRTTWRASAARSRPRSAPARCVTAIGPAQAS
ncbi:MAG: carbon storage regulator CsrA [Phycisphaerales bacterium]